MLKQRCALRALDAQLNALSWTLPAFRRGWHRFLLTSAPLLRSVVRLKRPHVGTQSLHGCSSASTDVPRGSRHLSKADTWLRRIPSPSLCVHVPVHKAAVSFCLSIAEHRQALLLCSDGAEFSHVSFK